MYRFADIGRLWVPVDLPTGEDGETARIWLLQTVYTREELRARQKAARNRIGTALLERLRNATTVDEVDAIAEETLAAEDADVEALRTRTHGWRDVKSEDGAHDEPFAPEKLDALLKLDWFARVACEAHLVASREGVRKNSSPGVAGSPARVQA